MWLAIKKLALTILLPILGFFSFSANKSADETPVSPPQAAEQSARQPAIPQGTNATSPSVRVGSAKEVSLDALKNCLGKAGESGKCLDAIFRSFLKNHSATEALAVVQQYEDADTTIRLSCHPIVHAVGRETFLKTGTVHDSFAACDQTCHSGCYHGAMERFLRGGSADDDAAAHISAEELQTKTKDACDPKQAVRFRFQCLHGLGHALMFFLDYKLETALANCDLLGDSWSRSSCYGGAFMENVFTATPEKRDLSATDYHYPCSKLDDRYKPDCYMMQTTRMTEMGLSTERLFEECRKAGNYWSTCMQSIGRDLSNTARAGDPQAVAQKCELGTPGGERQACIRGVAYALLDNTWDGRYAFPFCAKLSRADDIGYCFAISTAYLKGTFDRRPTDVSAECTKFAPSSQVCRDAAARL